MNLYELCTNDKSNDDEMMIENSRIRKYKYLHYRVGGLSTTDVIIFTFSVMK